MFVLYRTYTDVSISTGIRARSTLFLTKYGTQILEYPPFSLAEGTLY